MLVKRLNISTAASDSTYLYGIKINYLVDSVHRLEKELDEILEPLHMTEPGISAKELLKKRNEGI